MPQGIPLGWSMPKESLVSLVYGSISGDYIILFYTRYAKIFANFQFFIIPAVVVLANRKLLF